MNNLLLALITQEFSLAVLSLSLKQSINCPRCLVCLFVIQFTRYRAVPAMRCELVQFTTKKSSCQEVFSLFFDFFTADPFLPALSKPFIGKLAYITIPCSICQALFTIFLSLFWWFFLADICAQKAKLSQEIPHPKAA